MGDPFKKVQAGQKLEVPAVAYNAMLDAARFVRDGQLEGNPQALFRQTGIVKVRNDSGQDLDRFAILGIDEPIVSPTDNLQQFKNQVALAGVAPTRQDHMGKFVVLLEPLKDGAIGMAAADGVTVVRIDVVHPTDPTADVEDGVTGNLKSGNLGAAFILWKEAGTGMKWAVVRIVREADLTRFQLIQNLDFNGSAEAVELVWNGSSYEPVGPAFTVHATLPGRDSWGPAKASWYGWCKKKLDRNAFEIVHMQRFAQYINYTASSISGGVAMATVDTYWHGQNPGESVQVRFHVEPITGFCGYSMPTTVKGVAAFDERISSPDNPIYRSVEIEGNPYRLLVSDTDPCPGTSPTVANHAVGALTFGRGLGVTAGSCEATVDLQLMASQTPGCIQDGLAVIPANFPFNKLMVGRGIVAGKTADCELIIALNLEVGGNKPVAKIVLGEGLATKDFAGCEITLDLKERFAANQVKTVVTNVQCVDGSLVVTKETWTFNKCGVLISIT